MVHDFEGKRYFQIWHSTEVAKDLQFPAKVSGLYLSKTEFCICSKCTTRRSTSDDLAECLKEDKGEGGVVIIHTFEANINQKMKSTVNPKRGRKAVEWLGPQVLSRPVKRTLREAHWKRSQRVIFFAFAIRVCKPLASECVLGWKEV